MTLLRSAVLGLLILQAVGASHAQIHVDATRPKEPVERSLFSVVGLDQFHESSLARRTFSALNLRGTQARMEININRVEPENDDGDPRTFNWAAYEPRLRSLFEEAGASDSRAYIAGLVDEGIQPYFLFCYNSPWLGRNGSVTGPPTSNEEWAEYVCAVLEYFNGKPGTPAYTPVIEWAEIWNEPAEAGLYWDGGLDDYYQMFNVVARRIHDEYPGVRVGGPTLLNTDPIFLKGFLEECGQQTDFIANHMYEVSPSQMRVQIEGWMRYAREKTGRVDLRMNISETDHRFLEEREKVDYMTARTFEMIRGGGALCGFQHFCGISFRVGIQHMGTVFEEGGVIPKNYWPLWLFRHIEGNYLPVEAPPDVYAVAALDPKSGRIETVLMMPREAETSRAGIVFTIPPLAEDHLMIVRQVIGTQPRITGARILGKGTTICDFVIERKQESVITTITIQPLRPDSTPLIETSLAASDVFAGSTQRLEYSVLNTLNVPMEAAIGMMDLPEGWIASQPVPPQALTSIPPGEIVRGTITLSINSPTTSREGAAVRASLAWKSSGREGTEEALPHQLKVRSPFVFDRRPLVLHLLKGQSAPLRIGFGNQTTLAVQGEMALSIPPGLRIDAENPTRRFLLDAGAHLSHDFRLTAASDIPAGTHPITIDINSTTSSGERITTSHTIPVVIGESLGSGAMTPIDLRPFFNADCLTSLSNPTDVSNFGGLFSIPSEFFPDPGTMSFLGVPFLIPPASGGFTNCVRVDGQTVPVRPGVYTKLHFLGTATNGNKDVAGQIVRSDGTREEIRFRLSNWTSPPACGEKELFRAPYRHEPAGDLWDSEPAIFVQSVALPEGPAPIESIILPPATDVYLVALTLQSGTESPGAPGAEAAPAAPPPPLTNEVLFRADFSSPDWMKHWTETGAVAPFNKIGTRDGALLLEGGLGNDWFGLAKTEPVELGDKPLAIKLRFTHRPGKEADETCFWFVDRIYTSVNPWNRPNFIRLLLVNWGQTKDTLSVQRDFGGGVGRTLAQVPGIATGQPHDLIWIMDRRMYWVMLDGKVIASGAHDMEFTRGHLYITDFNSVEGDIDTIEALEIGH